MRSQHPYAAQAYFILPAWDRPQVSRIILVLFGFELALMLTPGLVKNFAPAEMAVAFAQDTTPFGTVISFASFGLTLLMFHAVTKLLADRGIQTMIGPLGQFWQNFKTAFIAVGLALAAVEVAPPPLELDHIAEQRDFLPWALWLIPGTCAIILQSFTEEVVYRGYLQQQLAVLSENPLIWMVVPSVMFGVSHYFNGTGPADGVLWAVWATFLGLACADLTARTGSIGAAVGLHSVNNLFAVAVTSSVGWPGSGLALFLFPNWDPTGVDLGIHTLFAAWAVVDVMLSFLLVFIMWLAARIALRV